MKLYAQYLSSLENLRKGGKTINKAYFTSFNLSPEFFETYILPPLLEEDVPDNSFQYESLNVKLEELEKKLDIKVFHDANMMQLNEQKRTILKFNPILMTDEHAKRKGLFHPKVIYLENETKGILFVGSGNLTLSGWGRNIEAFQIVDVERNSNLHKQIDNFFLDVALSAGLYKNEKKNYKSTFLDQGYNFIYSFKSDSESSLFLKSINAENSSNFYVCSPYFSESKDDNIDSLIEHNFPEAQNIHIIPDLVGAEKKIRLKNKPQSEKIKFYALKDQDSENMNHSKVWITDTKMGIGSYNFTKEALFGVNFEAALIQDVQKIDLDLEPIDFNQMNETELKSEELTTNTQFNVMFELIADYEFQSFEVKQLVGEKIASYSIVLPSGIISSNKNLENISTYDKAKIFRALIKNKIFKIEHQKKIVYEGIIFENSTRGYREPVKVETINDLFISFLDKKEPFSSKKLKNRNINFDENNNDSRDTHMDTSYLNYYNLFKGFENLNNKLREIKDERTLRYYCFTSGNSISSIMLIIEEYKTTHHNLFTYLFINEFNNLAKEVNKIIDKNDSFQMKSIQEVTNINLKLSKDDKKFLKAFYG